MRAAAILGLGCSPKDLKPFQTDSAVEWRMGLPAAEDGANVILLFGGDGTIHRHLGQLVKLGIPVLIVPTGSGNDFATSLGLKRVRDSREAWQKFCAGTARVRSIDLGVITPGKNADEASAPPTETAPVEEAPATTETGGNGTNAAAEPESAVTDGAATEDSAST